MRLSTRLTVAMVALVLLATTAVGALSYRNIAAFALPRALDRLDMQADLLGSELAASVRGARRMTLSNLLVGSAMSRFASDRARCQKSRGICIWKIDAFTE